MLTMAFTGLEALKETKSYFARHQRSMGRHLSALAAAQQR